MRAAVMRAAVPTAATAGDISEKKGDRPKSGPSPFYILM
jgi:hypothetical protein